MGKKSVKNNDLGRAIARKQQQKSQNRNAYNTQNAQIAAAVGRHTERGSGQANLVSVLEASDLEELMTNATLANENFAAERHAQPITTSSQSVIVVTPTNYNNTINERKELNENELRIPRRPPWSKEMTFEELMQNEEQTFLTWRRRIAELENDVTGSIYMLTPFEKNLDVWRQLWRVVERSDIVLQIVDARNPSLFACTDLVRMVVDEMNKKHLLVMNKADLLSSDMLEAWHRHFSSQGIDVVFFSAFAESVNQPSHDHRVVNANQLIEQLGQTEVTRPPVGNNDDNKVVVGMCGYPNVGKSSTINVLLETAANDSVELQTKEDSLGSEVAGDDEDEEDDDETKDGEESDDDDGKITGGNEDKSESNVKKEAVKRVAVSSTPGKTKHFQTLPLTDHITLCDCPGLVFPNFAASKAELICAGVLSIDTMRGDYETPVSLITSRIPYSILAAVYGLTFATPSNSSSRYVSAETFLDTHARARGYMTDHGRPDRSRSARVVLKDFVSGRLVFAHHPEGLEKGEPGIGAAVFAKKGKLVHRRLEEHEQKQKRIIAKQAKRVTKYDMFGIADQMVDEGERSSSVGVKAFVSGRKQKQLGGREGKRRGKPQQQEFVRVERTYDSSASAIK